MKKTKAKIILFEILYILFGFAANAIGIMIQFLYKKKIGRNSGMVFSGDIYQYNYFFYLLGAMVFFLFLASFYMFFFRDKIKMIKDTGIVFRIIYGIISAVLCIVCFFVNLLLMLVLFGLGDDIKPSVLVHISVLGWPICMLIMTLGTSIYHAHKKSK